MFFHLSTFTYSGSHDLDHVITLLLQDIDKLQLSDSERQSLRSYLDQDAVLIIGEYRVKASGRTVVIGATHLTYNKFEYLDIPCLQVLVRQCHGYPTSDTKVLLRSLERHRHHM